MDTPIYGNPHTKPGQKFFLLTTDSNPLPLDSWQVAHEWHGGSRISWFAFKRILIYSDLKYDPPRRPRKMRIIDPRRSTLPFIRRQTGKHFLPTDEHFPLNHFVFWRKFSTPKRPIVISMVSFSHLFRDCISPQCLSDLCLHEHGQLLQNTACKASISRLTHAREIRDFASRQCRRSKITWAFSTKSFCFFDANFRLQSVLSSLAWSASVTSSGIASLHSVCPICVFMSMVSFCRILHAKRRSQDWRTRVKFETSLLGNAAGLK